MLNLAAMNPSNDSNDHGLTISANYNLLSDSTSVQWRGDSVTLMKPYGLSNAKMVHFRNFKGELLPYTSINLPDLRVKVILTSHNIKNASITGYDTVYGETLGYSETTSPNVVMEFRKAWTYNVDEESQLMYNLKECVEEINRRMKIMYPIADEHSHIYGIPEVFNQNLQKRIFTTEWYSPICMGSFGLFYEGDKQSVTILNSEGHLERNRSMIPEFTYVPYYMGISYDASLVFWVRESNSSSLYGHEKWAINTGTFAEPLYSLIPELRWENYTTFNNYFGIDTKSPSITIGNYLGEAVPVSSPLITRGGADDLGYAMRDLRNTKKQWFYKPPTAYNKIFSILSMSTGINLATGEQNTSNAYFLVAFLETSTTYKIGLFTAPIEALDASNAEGPFTLISLSETSAMNISNWNTYDKLALCGKETYNCYYMDAIATGLDATYIWFQGSWICKYTANNNLQVFRSLGFKYDSSNLLQQDSSESGYYTLDISSVTQELVVNIFNNNGGVPSKDYSKIWIPGMEPPMLIKNGSGELKGIIQNPYNPTSIGPSERIEFNPQHLPNAIMCESDYSINMKATGTDSSGSSISLVKTNYDGTATTNLFQFFKFNYDDINIELPQLNFSNDCKLMFNILIDTDPYYFDMRCNVAYDMSVPNFSITEVKSVPKISFLNDKVISTIETLILLKYEYNGLYIVCSQFPNNDGVIFYINEDAHVVFKTMSITNTTDGLTIQIHSGGEPVTKELLARMYGKLAVSIDWEQ